MYMDRQCNDSRGKGNLLEAIEFTGDVSQVLQMESTVEKQHLLPGDTGGDKDIILRVQRQQPWYSTTGKSGDFFSSSCK